MITSLNMTEFKRSPSKVWWGSDSTEWRESPGSQDSGFSDTETSPNLQQQQNAKINSSTPKKETPSQRIPKDIFKQLTTENQKQNLSCNFKEKTTPEKDNLAKRLAHAENKPEDTETDAARKADYVKNPPKVSRNLFNSNKTKTCANQYSDEAPGTNAYLSTSREVTVDDSYSHESDEETERSIDRTTKSLPLRSISENFPSVDLSKSAPAVLEPFGDDDGAAGRDNSLSSDCESELECLFEGLEPPEHTSTPNGDFRRNMRQRNEKLPILKCRQYRVPPIPSEPYTEIDNKSVAMWLKEARQNYYQECMTTLQCKSILGELNQKVSHLAARATAAIRGVIAHSRYIETEYNNTNKSEPNNSNFLIENLAANISDFVKTHAQRINPNVSKLCDEVRTSKGEVASKMASALYTHWRGVRQQVLSIEIKKLIDKLERPASELDLRATITGITSVALRNEQIVELFVKFDIVPVLLILCEKCEGSSLRILLLRALSTMCCTSSAIRHFEKFSGVQIISDTLDEDSRPEPERSEAAALLAQVTAPWLEDNHSVKGLEDYSRKLVGSLTKFAAETKCCQNLLLCAAALANLSTMDSKSIKYMIRDNTAKVLMESIRARGPAASIYLLEQMATLLANMSASEMARKRLVEIKAPAALLCFLKMNLVGEDVEKRLRQKSVIALSRLCGERDAAMQVVDLGGVEKLVKMCREKEERFDSDAVLVAALATLRKIVDTCGSDVLSIQDAQELVEPKLLDSFLAYSSQNESYV